MSAIKNLHRLQKTGANEDQLEALQVAAAQFQRHANITFKVLEVDSGTVEIGNPSTGETTHKSRVDVIVVEARQGKNSLNKYLSDKELIERAKGLFGRFYKEVHVRPKPYQSPLVDVVNPQWLQQQLNQHKVSLKQLEKDTGIDKSNLSNWVNGNRPMSQPVKAMFYYYFVRS